MDISGMEELRTSLLAAARIGVRHPTDSRTDFAFVWTPRLATLALATNSANPRPLDARTVAKYAMSMGEGDWTPTGGDQPIKFCRGTGELLLKQGQHRLSAVVKSGECVEMLTALGDEGAVLDVSKNDSDTRIRDVRTTHGIDNKGATVAVKLLSLEQGNRAWPRDVIARRYVDSQELIDAVRKGLDRNRIRLASVIAAFVIAIEGATGEKREAVREVLSELSDLDGMGQHACVILRIVRDAPGGERNEQLSCKVLNVLHKAAEGRRAPALVRLNQNGLRFFSPDSLYTPVGRRKGAKDL